MSADQWQALAGAAPQEHDAAEPHGDVEAFDVFLAEIRGGDAVRHTAIQAAHQRVAGPLGAGVEPGGQVDNVAGDRVLARAATGG